MKILLAVAAASAGVLISSPAHSQSFPGARIEANVGWDHVNGDLSYTDSAYPADDFTDHRSTDGVLFGVTVGYDYPVGDGVYLGAEASIDFASNEKCEAVYSTVSACFNVKRNIALGGRAGMRINPSSMAYLGAAFVNGKATVSLTDSAGPGDIFSESDSRDGYRLFAGLEHKLGGNTYAKIEYRYSNYADYNASYGTQSASLGFDRHQVLVGAGVRF